MESWREVWRKGFVPGASTAGLVALREALAKDDARLAQGLTVTPPPLQCVSDWPVEAADAIGLMGWLGDGLERVGEVEKSFVRACFDADQRLGEPAACRWFLNWYDDTPRNEMIRELLAETELAIARRVGTPDDEAFRRAIADAPDDSIPSLVYADWLDEQGRTEEAIVLRRRPT